MLKYGIHPRRMRPSLSDQIFQWFVGFFVLLVLLLTLYPLYFVVIASVSDPEKVALGKVLFWPSGIQAEGYLRVFRNQDIWRSYLNTLYYTSLGTGINLAATMTAAFVFSRRKIPGIRPCMLVIVFTMYFGGGMIPNYFNIRNLGLLNTVWALVLPGAIGTSNMIIARSYIMSTIPDALDEAARMDGCQPIRYYLSIVLPLSLPIIGVLTLYCVVGHWNTYYSALVYIIDRKRYPLQLILREILVQNKFTAEDLSTFSNQQMEAMKNYQDIAESMKYSLIIVSSLPMLVLYPFLQRFFVKGLMIGSLKG